MYKNGSNVVHEMTTHVWEDTVFQFLVVVVVVAVVVVVVVVVVVKTG